jgi:aspartate/methionine/tyrosine aminotransferase
MDLGLLADLATEDTRLLIINVPHNPTGYLPSASEFDEILELAARRGLWLFCDEMYRGLEYDLAVRLPSAVDRYPRAVSLWGMSKTFGLAGLRIGWLAAQDRELVRSLVRLKDYTTICSSAPSEFLARVALEQAETIIQRNLDVIQANLRHAHSFMARWTDVFTWNEPLAASVAFALLRQGSATAFCEEVVRGSGVLLVPSTLFDFGDRHTRWGLGRLDFPQGLTALDEYLSTKHKNLS